MPDNYGRLLLGMIAVSVLVCACDKRRDVPHKGTDQTPDVKTVDTVKAVRRALWITVEQPGFIQADEETHLYARVAGYVSRVPVDIGHEVKRGDVLAEIAVPELVEEEKQKQAVVRQSKAEIEQAEKALASAEANIAAMQAAVTEAKAVQERWQAEAKRIARLVDNGTVEGQIRDETQQQFKAAAARVLAAEAAVRKASADRDKASADLVTARARVDVASADARRLEALVGFAKIQAPYDGTITVRSVNTGDLVQPGKGGALFTISKTTTVRAVVDVPETDAALVQKNKSTMSLNVPALRVKGVEGTVTRTSWALKSGARTLRVEMDLPNDKERYRPGMYIYGQIRSQTPATWTLPVSALVKQGDKTLCYLVKEDAGYKKAVIATVQIGLSDGTFTEVLSIYEGSAGAEAVDLSTSRFILRATEVADGQRIQVKALTQ